MNILVGFKIVPDFDMFTEDDWIISSHFQVDTSFIKPMFNPYDESGLEIALRIRDKMQSNGEKINLTGFTIGDERSDMYLKTLMALKYDKAIKVNCNEDTRFNSSLISKIYKNYSKKNRQDIYILGSQSGEGENGKTPYLLAEELGIPCIASVIDFEYLEDEKLFLVTSQIENKIIRKKILPPAVVSIGNSRVSCLRIPTLKEKMIVSKKQFETISLKELGIEEEMLEEDFELVDLYMENTGREGIILEEEKLEKLFEEYFKELLEK